MKFKLIISKICWRIISCVFNLIILQKLFLVVMNDELLDAISAYKLQKPIMINGAAVIVSLTDRLPNVRREVSNMKSYHSNF